MTKNQKLANIVKKLQIQTGVRAGSIKSEQVDTKVVGKCFKVEIIVNPELLA